MYPQKVSSLLNEELNTLSSLEHRDFLAPFYATLASRVYATLLCHLHYAYLVLVRRIYVT